MDKPTSDPTKLTPKMESFEPSSVRVVKRNNNVTTRVSARPPMHMMTLSDSHRCDDSPVSSSFCTSRRTTTNFTSDRTEERCHVRLPSYMSLTESTKAKQRHSGGSNSKPNLRSQRQQFSMDEFQFMKHSRGFPYSDSLTRSIQLEKNTITNY